MGLNIEKQERYNDGIKIYNVLLDLSVAELHGGHTEQYLPHGHDEVLWKLPEHADAVLWCHLMDHNFLSQQK